MLCLLKEECKNKDICCKCDLSRIKYIFLIEFFLMLGFW